MRMFCLAFLACVCVVHAQEGLRSTTLSAVDSALSIMDMNRKDFTMRWDAVTDDSHRLRIVKELFGTPFKTFSYLRQHRENLSRFSVDNCDVLFDRIAKQCEIGKFQNIAFEEEIRYAQLKATINKNGVQVPLETVVSQTHIALLKRYVAPIIEAYATIQLHRNSLIANKIIVAHADSLLMMSSDDEQATPFEMREAELRGDSIATEYFQQAALVDYSRLYAYSCALYKHLLANVLSQETSRGDLNIDIKSLVFETAYGKMAFGGNGADVYNDDYTFIFDIGGNDVYLLPELTKEQAINRPVRVVIDLQGDDTYSAGDYSLASGVFGCGILIDANGNDAYKAGNFSLGAGLFGAGILHDVKGTDSYYGKVFSQGAGAFGLGLLVDDEGNDVYSVYAHGQAFGFTRGAGILSDKKGNDVYTTVSPFVDVLRYDSHFVSFTQGAALGHRPLASGGIGLLCDAEGNDSYTSDIYGQGTAYWYGIGALLDGNGEDRYNSYQYAQGSGVHFAHGVLWDERGDDVYVSHGVSQGCGHDVGFGALIDEYGNDSYVAESLSLGAGNANALSLFVDERGDDSYIARNVSNTMGFSDFRRSYGMIGVFVDGQGNDVYSEKTRNGTTSTKSTYGVFADLFGVVDADKQTSTDKKNEPTLQLESTPQRLFVQASTAPQKYQFMVNPAREALVKLGNAGWAFVQTKLSTTYPRERLALEYLLPKFYEQDSLGVTKVLLDSLASETFETQTMSAWAIGKCKIKAGVKKLLALTKDSDWRLRATAAQQLGEVKSKDALPELREMLNDTVVLVRARAAYSLSSISALDALGAIKIALRDNSQLVRNSAVRGLVASGMVKPSIVKRLMEETASSKAARCLMQVIPNIDSTEQYADVLTAILSSDIDIREACYRSLLSANTPVATIIISYFRDVESNSRLRVLLGVEPFASKVATEIPGMKATKKGKKR